MYFHFDKAKIYEDYPILSSDIDCILHFFSLDSVKTNDFDSALFTIIPDAYDLLFDSIYNGKLIAGSILPYRKHNPFIMHIPCKEKYDDSFNKDIVELGLEKFSKILSSHPEFSKIKKIGVQKETINIDIFLEKVNQLTFPEIVFFDKV